jgi:hypothetical protein
LIVLPPKIILETLPVHQLRGTFVASSRGQGIDAQPAAGSDHVPVSEERQTGINKCLF